MKRDRDSREGNYKITSAAALLLEPEDDFYSVEFE